MDAQVREYADAPASIEEDMIRRARLHVPGDDREKTVERVAGIRSIGLTRREIGEAYESAVRWEPVAKCPSTTAWGLVLGLTRLSQGWDHANQRDRTDRAGKGASTRGGRDRISTSRTSGGAGESTLPVCLSAIVAARP